jgi:hypothetical protein
VSMPVLTATWPIEALPFEEALTPVVESFLAQCEAFDMSRSAVSQLYERVNELEDSASKDALLDLVSNVFGEFDCLAICTSGVLRSLAVMSQSSCPHCSDCNTHG